MKRVFFISVPFIFCVILLYVTWTKGRELSDLRGREEAFLNRNNESPLAAEPVSPNLHASTDVPSTNTPELLQLRGEIVRLELRKKELMSARSENERLKGQLASMSTTSTSELPPDYIRKSKAQDRGFATPQATLETFLWAVQNTNVEKVFQC